ncbi:MAG: helix-turn-helix domain-containing protein [Pseudohongiellaceae bacterium]|jgi:two-component system response regulator PilR (NtrC family)
MAERTARYTSQIYNVAIVYNIYRILLPLILLVTFISSRNTTLFFRINVIELAAPSLRERQEGLQELTLTILHKIANEDATAVCEIDEEALDSLRQYSFPGNVRELENILHRAATLCEDKIIRASNLEFMSTPRTAESADEIYQEAISDSSDEINDILPQSNSNDIQSDFSLGKHLESIEIKVIKKALEETRWNKIAAAKTRHVIPLPTISTD